MERASEWKQEQDDCLGILLFAVLGTAAGGGLAYWIGEGVLSWIA